MKVIVAAPYFSPRVGGLETYALSLALELKNLGWDVVVISGDDVKKVTKSTVHGLTIYRLPIWKTLSNTPVNLAWPFMIRKIIKIEAPDVINVHTPVPFMVDSILIAAGKTPVAVTYHAASLLKPSSALLQLITGVYLAWEKLLYRRANHLIAVSPYVGAALAERFQRQVSVISNAVTVPAPSTDKARENLVFIANLDRTHAWKGLDFILQSLAISVAHSRPVTNLTVIGDGNDKEGYEKRARELGIDHLVNFAGRLTPVERDKVMSRSIALIAYPTTANDAFPTVFLEAWALKLPVIAASIGPLPSLVENDVTGILVEPSNPAALSQAISEVLSNPNKFKKMGSRGYALVANELNWPYQARKMNHLLEELI